MTAPVVHPAASELHLALRRFPPPLEDLMRRDLERLLFLVPAWCASLTVRYASRNRGRELAHAHADFEYRQATLKIRPRYFKDPAPERQVTLAHELTHLLLWPLSNVADTMAEKLTKPGTPLRRWACEEARKACEGATEDVGRALARIVRDS